MRRLIATPAFCRLLAAPTPAFSRLLAIPARGRLLSESPATEPAAETAAAAASPAEQVEKLEKAVAELTKTNAETHNLYLRALADAQNAKRFADQDIQSAKLFSLKSFAGDLLDVADTLDRAMQTKGLNPKDPFVEGIEAVRRVFSRTLSKHGVVHDDIKPRVTPFDANRHEALASQPDDVAPAGVITEIFSSGYTLSGRLLRPAKVVVSSGKAPRTDEE